MNLLAGILSFLINLLQKNVRKVISDFSSAFYCTRIPSGFSLKEINKEFFKLVVRPVHDPYKTFDNKPLNKLRTGNLVLNFTWHEGV